MISPERPKRVTINDLATEAGVSNATVSYVLSGRTDRAISEATRAKVLATAARLGYKRNVLAAALRTGRPNAIGVVCPVTAAPMHQFQHQAYLSNALLALTAAVTRRGMSPIVFFGGTAADLAPRDLADGRVAGAAILSGPGPRDWIEALLNTGLPCVEVGSAIGPNSVLPDHRQGVRDAVRHLFELGHRRLAYYAPWPDVAAAKVRLEAFRSSSAELGIASQNLSSGPDADELLKGKTRPTGLVCFNDASAVTAIRKAAALGLKVPDDLSIVGFDNDLRAFSCTPALTTLHNPLDEMAVIAIDMVMDLVRGAEPATKRVNVPAKLVLRDSTGPCPARVRPAT